MLNDQRYGRYDKPAEQSQQDWPQAVFNQGFQICIQPNRTHRKNDSKFTKAAQSYRQLRPAVRRPY